ncbi:MAG: FHA domain-containing protein [Rivularia sp. (in: cyanobacteria)]
MKVTVFNPIKGFSQEKLLAAPVDKASIFLIGRHPNCDIVLNSPEVSRVHGLINYSNENYYFVELASTDGSRVNNQEVLVNESCILKKGDIVQIDNFYLLFNNEVEKSEQPNPYWFLKSQNTEVYTEVASVKPETFPEVASVKQGEKLVICSQIIEETHDVKTFRFVTSPPTNFDYKPGQFVTLDLEIDGKSVKRSYSISSTPSRPHSLEVTIKRVPAPKHVADAPPGLVSNWLHDNLTVGNQIKISPSVGNFTIADDNPNCKFMFISAGSGITPMMSMSRWLCDTIPNADIVFVHSAKTTRDIVFTQELELMASRQPGFQLAITLTGKEYSPTWTGYTGRLNQKMFEQMSHDIQERIIYICGPDSFREGVKTLLRNLDFPMQNFHEESFGSFKPKKAQQVDTVPANPVSKEEKEEKGNNIVFTKSEQEIVCDAEETILQAAQREGLTLPYGCQVGVCGQCKLPLASGKVNYEQDYGCEDDCVLTCVGKAAGKVVIEG